MFKRGAAEILGISRRILKYKMDKLGISDKPIEPTADDAGNGGRSSAIKDALYYWTSSYGPSLKRHIKLLD